MDYNNENRGKIQCRERKKQIIDFSGLRYENITPTDLDGLIDWHGKAFVFYEFKYGEAKVPEGQRIAIERMINNLEKANKHAIAIICKHNVSNPHEDVPAACMPVSDIYFNGKWYGKQPETCKGMTDRFLKFVKEEEL